MYMSRNDSTIDNLTDQLCAYEKVLTNEVVESTAQEALAIDVFRKNTDQSQQIKIICNYY